MTAPQDKRDSVYHYTDVSGFQGILATKTLWLSDAYFTNDYTEHRLVLDKAVAKLKELAKEPRNSRFCTKLEASLLGVSIHPYVCCFSSAPDLLSQWRAYSDDGAGFAIGFSTAGIDRLWDRYFNKPWLISFRQVEYDPGKQETQLEELIAKDLARYLELFPGEGADYGYEGLEIATAHSDVWSLATIFKNHGFFEEQEHRLIVMPKANDSPPPATDIRKMCFRVSGGDLVPYFPICFEAEDVTEIRLGPRNHASNIRQSIEMFLWKNGYDVGRIEIKNSEATYGRR